MKYPRLGAIVENGGVTFRVWAPNVERLELVMEESGETRAMDVSGGYFTVHVEDAAPGQRYRFRLNGDAAFPDPASRFQPEGVHGPSEIVDPKSFVWRDATWEGLPREDLVFYELHIGTFTREGTYRGVEDRLEYLRQLGVTAIELMPVADFPGDRNWGYDPAALYAPSRAYGRPDELRSLVDAAHRAGLAVFLDVIYNHLGPDGAYIAAYAPMFTEKHHTPWGAAMNLDDKDSTGVRGLFIDNALHWLREYHLDGLRLDATDRLIDDSPTHFLAELSDAVSQLEGPRRFLVAEDARNVNTVVRSRTDGGYGLDAIWTDDFHHQIRNMTAGDRESYYADYDGSTMREVAETIRNGWYFDGRRSPTTHKPRGTSSKGIGHDQCVIAISNHDQVGNRPLGNRLSSDIEPEVYRAASALLLFLPHLPLLFMGQEWSADTPFLFFTDHNPELGKLVTEGRRKEFGLFSGFAAEVPDPQDPKTFEDSRLRWEEIERNPHKGTLALYHDLLALRRELGGALSCEAVSAKAIQVQRGRHMLVATFEPATALPLPEGFELLLHTEQQEYAPSAQPPDITDGLVRFDRAGALIGRLG